MIKPAISLILAFVIFSCSNKHNSSVDCVNTFIDAAREHDMTKAWNTLSSEAQAFYNDLGEKNRKSGKGILEHDIEEVVKFKNSAGYKVVSDPVNSKTVFITRSTGVVYTIETVEGNGDYKIKDETSVRNIIKGIAEEIVKKNYYQ